MSIAELMEENSVPAVRVMARMAVHIKGRTPIAFGSGDVKK